jgi:peptidoglycan/xylan/chitin deacetylase (PgdA/CDA1 family)
MEQSFAADVDRITADNLKAVKADLEAQIAGVVGGGDPQVITDLQADVAALDAALYTLAEVVDEKVDTTALATALASKVSTSTYDAFVTATNGTLSTLSTVVGGKAESSALTSGLALKADAAATASALAGKADASALTSGLAAKADATATTTALNLKADTTALTAGLATKADAATMTTALAGKTSPADVLLAARSATRVAARPAAGWWAPSYDDGWASHVTLAAAHAARGQLCTLYITTANLGVAGKMTAAQVTAAYAAGHEIGSHNVAHTSMTTTETTPTLRAAQFGPSKTALELLTAAGAVTSYCYPYGDWSDTSDLEAYGWYDRVADIGLSQAFNKTQWTYPKDARPFRHGRFPWSDTTHAQFLAELRSLATQPKILTSYGHDADSVGNPTMAQYIEAMDLARDLGIPVMRTQDAFPAAGGFVNSRFESGSIQPWNLSAPTGTATIETETPTDFGGAKVVHLTNTNAANSTYLSQEFVDFVPGRVYTVSMRCRVANLAGASRCSIRVLQYGQKNGANSSGNISSVLAATGVTSTTWVVFSTTFTADVNATNIIIRPEMNAETGDMWVDRMWVGESRWGAFS